MEQVIFLECGASIFNYFSKKVYTSTSITNAKKVGGQCKYCLFRSNGTRQMDYSQHLYDMHREIWGEAMLHKGLLTVKELTFDKFESKLVGVITNLVAKKGELSLEDKDTLRISMRELYTIRQGWGVKRESMDLIEMLKKIEILM